VVTEETFGPVVTVAKVRDMNEAVMLANASRYGLAASVFAKTGGRRGNRQTHNFATRPHMKAALFDLDGTLIPGALGLELARKLAADAVPIALEELEQLLVEYQRGSISYEQMTRQAHSIYAHGLAGLPVRTVEEAANQVWQQVSPTLHHYARPLIARLQDAGFTVLLLSGSPRETVKCAAAELEVDRWMATTLQVRDGHYTAHLTAAPSLSGGKLHALHSCADDIAIDLANSIAIGNSPSDAELFEIVGHPFAFEPDTALRQLATDRGWPIINRHNTLETIHTTATRSCHNPLSVPNHGETSRSRRCRRSS
jgi:HAD superfamily hydrolase (TIGR01490 family)